MRSRRASFLSPIDTHPTSPKPPPLPFQHVEQPEQPEPNYFHDVNYSPVSPDSNSEPSTDNGSHTDLTLDHEDTQTYTCYGHPLHRCRRLGSVCRRGDSTDDDASLDEYAESSDVSASDDSESPSPGWPSQGTVDYDAIINTLVDFPVDPFVSSDNRDMVSYSPPQNSPLTPPHPIMIKRLIKGSSQLSLFIALNEPRLRKDPWNPAPHVVDVIEHKSLAYVCMERLHEYDHPKMTIISQYIDFFRQILEGLTFLHEQGIVGFACAHPVSYMVDLSSGLPSSSTGKDAFKDFDRKIYPVKYYFVNLSQAQYVGYNSRESLKCSKSMPPSPFGRHAGISDSHAQNLYKKDVWECGVMFDCLLADIPPVSQVLQPLVEAMTLGNFSADEALTLFDTQCQTIKTHVFEMHVLPSHTHVETRLQSTSMPRLDSSILQSKCKLKTKN